MTVTVDVAVLSDLVKVEVSDPDHADICAEFHYGLDEKQNDPSLIEVRFTRPDDQGELDVSAFRERPIGRWEKAARSGALSALDEERQERNAQILESLQAAADQGDFQARRALSALTRLLSVALQYRENVASGVRDPVAQIARAQGVKPATARTWVKRARQAGLIGAALGPTAGERGPASRKSA